MMGQTLIRDCRVLPVLVVGALVLLSSTAAFAEQERAPEGPAPVTSSNEAMSTAESEPSAPARVPVSRPREKAPASKAHPRSAHDDEADDAPPVPLFSLATAASIGLGAGLSLAAPSVLYAGSWWAITLSQTAETNPDDNWAPFLAIGTTALSVIAVGFLGATGVVFGVTVQRAVAQKNGRPIAAAIGAALLFAGAGTALVAVSVAGARKVDPLRIAGLAAGATFIAAAGPAALAAALFTEAAQEE